MSGVLWATASGIGFGLFQSINRRAIRGIEDPYVSTFLQLSVATAILVVASLLSQDLSQLGEASGVGLVTAEHREIGAEAHRHGVAYKISGAGGGDLGLACAADPERLEAFRKSVADRGFRVINVSLADHGLQVAHSRAGWQR